MHNETSLKALTVPKLKELLLKSNLIQSGKKDELIQRLLENPNSLLIDDELSSSSNPTASTSTAATTETVVDASTSTIISSSEIIPVVSVPTPSVVVAVETPVTVVVEAVVEVELTAEEKQAKATAEEEKRKKRMERFGSTVSTPDLPSSTTSTSTHAVVDPATEALNKRAERFGLVKEVVVSEKKESNLEKSLAALDKPLNDRKQKLPKTAAVVPAVSTTVVVQEVKIVDPELAIKIAAEEEKKRKRAARFGEEPAEKKAKVDA